MLKIFAKKGTDEKALVPCKREEVGKVMQLLEEKYSGIWLLVDELRIQGEILKFNDDMIYQGYSSDIKRYSTIDSV